MGNIIGTYVNSKIVPSDSRSSFPTHDESYGLGGYRSCNLYEDIFKIPYERLKIGSLIFVKYTKDDNDELVLLEKFYIVDNLNSTISGNVEITYESINGLVTETVSMTVLQESCIKECLNIPKATTKEFGTVKVKSNSGINVSDGEIDALITDFKNLNGDENTTINVDDTPGRAISKLQKQLNNHSEWLEIS